MKYRLLASTMALSMTVAVANAQEQKSNLFNQVSHIELGVTLGTTGIGFDVAIPATDKVWLRTGFSYMPKVEVPMTFDVQALQEGEDPANSQSNFNKMADVLYNITGYQAKPEVEMLGKPNFWHWNFMVDVFPFENNPHWHATVGFFLGPSKVAEAYNRTECMPSLMSVNIYNRMYDKLHGKTLRELVKEPLFNIPGLEDFGTDPELLLELQKRLDNYGRMGIWLGNYKQGEEDEEGTIRHNPYMMDPDENCMVSAEMRVNAFKPYLGIGYEGRLIKDENRLSIGFDAGILLWGGTPHLKTHDGTDLIHDVENVLGKVGDYANAIEKFKVFPLLNLRVAYKLF